MPEVRIAAEPRTEFGKGPARRERQAGRVPAVLYGHGTDTRHITLPGHAVMMALKTANVLIRLDGLPGGNQLVLPKAVQRDPIRGFVEHVDFILVRRGEKVTVEVPVEVTGEVFSGGLLDQQLVQVSIEAEATNIPGAIEVDVQDMADRHRGARRGPQAARRVVAGDGAGHPGAARDRGAHRGADGSRDRRARGRGGCPGRACPGARGRGRARGARRGGRRVAWLPARVRAWWSGLWRKRTAAAGEARAMPDDRWLIAGLGNPGAGYAGNRHNAGYLVADELARRIGGRFKPGKFRTSTAEGRLAGTPVTVLKPLTYMNESGGPVAGLRGFYHLPADRIVVVHDELDLPYGTIRLKFGGGDNGHNGLRSITAALGTRDYYRVRFGIGRPPGRMDPAAYVLRDFTAAEREELPFLVDRAADAVEALLHDGLAAAQNQFHTEPLGK